MKWNKHQAATWKDYTPPSKLSDSELKIYEDYIKKYKHSKILILGSTVELRDVCYKHNIIPFVVDNKKEVYRIWTSLIKRKGKDVFINKDWLNMNFKFKFGLILGDLCFQQLTSKKQHLLAKKINFLLDKDGISLQRTWQRDANKEKSITDVVKIGKKASKKYKENLNVAIELGLINYYYDIKSDSTGSGPMIIAKMKKDFDKGHLPKSVYSHFAYIWDPYKNSNYLAKKKDFEKMISKHLKIKKTVYGKDSYRRLCPVYILGRK